MRFTHRSIVALKPRSERYEVWEDGRTGLGVRISPKGRKSWLYMYRFEGRARRMTIGTYPEIGLADARIAHATAKAMLEKRIDPGRTHVERRQAEQQAETVAELVQEYLEKWARPRKRSAAEDERILRKDVIPAWGRRKAADIKRRDVILLLDRIVERGAPIQANRVLAVVRKMFNFAVSRGVLDATPVAMIRAPSKENQRDRVLSADEIRAFWHGLEEARMTEGVRLVLKLELATAQRKGEIASARKEDFDLIAGVWTIPSERSKNGRAHRVPLSPMARELVEAAIALTERDETSSDWLFPSPRGDRPISPEAVNHALRKARLSVSLGYTEPAIPIENFCPHDLRRTAASGMTALGISRLVVAKVLNHVETGVTAVYDRHSYDDEKRRALEAWADKLLALIEKGQVPENVIPLQAAVADT